MPTAKPMIWSSGITYSEPTCHCSICVRADNMCALCRNQKDTGHLDIICPKCPNSFHRDCRIKNGSTNVKCCEDLGAGWQCHPNEPQRLKWIGARRLPTDKLITKWMDKCRGKHDKALTCAVAWYKSFKWY